jgi:hypothetical protein
MQNKVIISFREGCSGSWLAELLMGSTFTVFYRQDQNGKNIPKGVFHFNGHEDSQVHQAIEQFSGETCITCHSTNYKLLKHHWPNHKIVRIKPHTHVLDSIEASYNKLGTGENYESVDLAFEYIKQYCFLHNKLDPVPQIDNSCVIDYGQLRYLDKLTEICRNIFDVELSARQLEFAQDYWNLQTSKSQVFKIARYIYEYETRNNYQEKHRLWSINDIIESVSEPYEFLKYCK